MVFINYYRLPQCNYTMKDNITGKHLLIQSAVGIHIEKSHYLNFCGVNCVVYKLHYFKSHIDLK